MRNDDLTPGQRHTLELIESMAVNGSSLNDRVLLEHTVRNGNYYPTLNNWLAEMKSKHPDLEATRYKAKLIAGINK